MTRRPKSSHHGKRLRRLKMAHERADAERRRGSDMPVLMLSPRVACPDCQGGVCPVDGRKCP